MKELRTYERTAYYNSSWELESVIGKCQEKGIPGEKVGVAIARCRKFIKGFNFKNTGGALVIIFKLMGA